MGLIGRAAETGRLHDLISGVGKAGATLILRGEPGIGKTALLADATAFARASGMRVLRTTGVESETHLPYAGLHQLLRPVRDSFGVLPPSQRDALRAALGITEGTVPEGYLAALAVLNLLAEVAEADPVLVVAEDAHWLDPSTADVLAFLGRRLESEPILLLASLRDGSPARLDEARLPAMTVPPLSAQSAEQLLDRTAAGLPAAVRRRLLSEAAGNPLALIELPAAVRGTGGPARYDDAGGPGVLAHPWLPLTARLESAFTRRFAVLPAATQAALEAAALNDSADLAETLAAASLLTGTAVTTGDLLPAVDARLIEPGEHRLTFHHPLVRSAIHQGTDPGRRRAVHRALAGVLTEHPDRRTWHLAAASDRPDEGVAAALEAVAVRAQRRGSGAAVVTALEQAARLSP
ncbi:MAG TPA: AAA family ATPase, partial [Trebonia sp.]|nr:AAA family ATPase [Trebonia sp.]